MQVRRMRAAGALAAGALLVVGSGTAALAGDSGHGDHDGEDPEPVLPLNSSPDRGPLGTVITISGDSCTEEVIEFELSREDGEVVASSEAEVDNPDPDPYEVLYLQEGDGGGDPEPFGTFEGTLQVPEDRTDLIGETLNVDAICNPVYQTRSFLVIDPNPPVVGPGDGTGGAGGAGGVGGAGGTTPTTARAAAPARTASPVSGRPTYTG